MNNIEEIKKQEYIRLYNHGAGAVSIPLYSPQRSESRGCIVEGEKKGEPGYTDVTWRDIEYINHTTSAFKTGMLCFAKEDEEVIYKELRIFNWKDILFEEEIEDIISDLYPTMEKLQRIIGIKDIRTIERVRGRMLYRINNGFDISNKLIEVVNARFKEISNGKKNSDILLVPKGNPVEKSEKDVEKLQDEVAALKAMVTELVKAKE